MKIAAVKPLPFELAAMCRPVVDRCEVCDVKLPRGLKRTRCFEHSELVQSLVRFVDRRAGAATARAAA